MTDKSYTQSEQIRDVEDYIFVMKKVSVKIVPPQNARQKMLLDVAHAIALQNRNV